MTMVAETVDLVVVGGDTHRDQHWLDMIDATGASIGSMPISNDTAGYAAAIDWITDRAAGRPVLIGLEGTRSYGIGLCRALQAAGFSVVEVEQPDRPRRRRAAKSDPIDAHRAALAVWQQPAHQHAIPRADGTREALRILLTAREELTTNRTGQINRLRALLLTGDDADRASARGRLTLPVLQQLTRRRSRSDDDVQDQIRRHELRRLSLAIIKAGTELADNKTQLTTLVDQLAPGLLTTLGVGPVSAAQTIVSYSHRGRCRNDAAFAALAGVNPIPASSGRTTRHRLNRGGDRALNRAIHHIMLTRWRVDPRTHAYITTRHGQGRTDREIRRCLKRYIARELFRTLTQTMT